MTDGRRFRILEVFDDRTRECLTLVADTLISGRRVARELDAIIGWRGKPMTIVSDNGTELTSKAILEWADERQVGWHSANPSRTAQRELQRAAQGPALERDPDPVAAGRPGQAGSLAARLQRGPAPLEPRMPHAQGLRRSPAERPAGALRTLTTPRAGLLPAANTKDQINPGLSLCLDEKRGSGQTA
jgi:putative transposase